MFNYTVYGVGSVSGVQNSRWVRPVERVPEISPVSRGFEIGKVYGKQSEKSMLHNSTGDAGPDVHQQSYVRDVIRSGMDTLRFLGTHQMLLDISRPAEPEANYIEKYTEKLNVFMEDRIDLLAAGEEEEVDVDVDIEVKGQQEQGQQAERAPAADQAKESRFTHAMSNAVSTLLS